MDVKKQLSLVGTGMVLVSCFLPFISFFGMSISLFGASAGEALLVIILGAAAGGLDFMGQKQGNKMFIIIALVAAVLGLLLSLYWMMKASGMAGTGLYVMVAGFAVALAGTAMSFKNFGAAKN
ncbi:MAG TPA: hypothetical protein DEP18_07235 [Flavobacteriales bacterium]|nr:hypothetical protein [Flavobacteriales bacterium]HRE74761.1 hypothetical protein [Flavobacteriales bacterium]HRE97375.1 hypothetical protein [Flavobacteriales bacterium]HRJ35243.1 hypothetical protein [Flavobacteriales bacterium]HRJ40000.1 hypothetical protein [Flavobacteriales bacterium]